MSVERNPLGGGIDRETAPDPTGRTFPTRYDVLLALLPLPLLAGIVGAYLLSVPLAFGAGAGGLPSALLLAYGLFVAGPDTDRRTAAEPRRRDSSGRDTTLEH